jgi:hypothetical protein
LASSDSRHTAANGATLARLIGIVGGQVYFSSVLGVKTSIHLFYENGEHYFFPIELVAMLIGLSFVIYALSYAPIELKLFHFFAAAVLALAIRNPLAILEAHFKQWELMQIPGCANRYYFFPMLAFLATPIWMLTSSASKSKVARCSALVILLLLPIGIYRDWHCRPLTDLHFRYYTAEFERAAPGTKLSIPINPIWTMQLTKH